MTMSVRRPRIAVASDLSLVAETVRTALSSHGYDGWVVRWADPVAQRADAGLVICDLTPTSRLCEMLELVERFPHQWLLLTGAPPGPLWGGALRNGVTGVLRSSADLAEVAVALQRLLDGEPVQPPEQQEQWRREWQESRDRQAVLAARVESLTPRERTVLRLLYAGNGVRVISGQLDVSEATVRSHVKSVLRKFHVSSQLDAVAVLGWLRDDPESLGC